MSFSKISSSVWDSWQRASFRMKDQVLALSFQVCVREKYEYIVVSVKSEIYAETLIP